MPSLRTLRALSLLALTALVLSAGVSRLRTNDLFIHLVTGGTILDEGRIPTADRYSFTAPGARYVAHEWLAASWYALGERTAGVAGVIVASKVLPGLAILVALLAAFRAAGVHPAIGVSIATAAFAVARNRMTQDRPELIAIALLLTLLWLLLRDRARAASGAPDARIFWAAALAALWANVHASFPLGIALVLAFAVAEPLDVLLAPRDRRARLAAIGFALASGALAFGLSHLAPPTFSFLAAVAVAGIGLLFALDGFAPLFRTAMPAARYASSLRLLAVAGAMLAAVSLNPQGVGIYLFPFEFTAGVNTVTERIGEWRPLIEASFLSDSFELSAYLLYLATWGAALALASARGVLDRRDVGVLLLFGVLPLRHIRWMGLFALVTAPALAAALTRARAATPDGAAGVGRALRWAVAVTFGVAALAPLYSSSQLSLQGGPDPLFSSVLALVGLSAAVALALAALPSLGSRAGLAAAGGLCALLAVLAVAQGIPGRRAIHHQRGFQWSELDRVGGNLAAVAPAVDFMQRRGIGGRLMTQYPWAGYAIYRLWPDVTVFVDSRSEVYGDELLALLLDLDQQPALARRAIAQYGVDLVLFESHGHPYADRLRHNAGILDVVADDPDWGLLYFDDAAALYARRDAERRVPLPPFLEGIDPRRLTPRTLVEPDPAREAVLREATVRAPGASFPRYALASLLHARGASDEALRELETAWRANPRQPAAPELAGRIAEREGDREAARRWYERTLAVARDWSSVRARWKALQP